MEIINKKKVGISTSEELKDILENDNGYEYIYLMDNITLESGIKINEKKERIVIDGTYNSNRYTLTGMNSTSDSDTIIVSKTNKEVVVRNMNINYTNTYGVIYVPLDTNYIGILTTYNNINFNGTRLAYNPYGNVKIIDSHIIIEETNGIASLEICMGNYVIIGGKTTMTSSSLNSSLFYFRNNLNPSIVFLCKSNVTISTDTKEFMTGTNKLNFTILHDTYVNITTANGLGSNPVYGTNNVLIDERATLIFIQKSHQRVPVWAVFGTFTMKKNSNLEIINSYSSTPADNYNIQFKGSNCKLILDNPNSVIMYSRNASVFYTNNTLDYSIICKRINLWKNSNTLTSAGDIYDLPEYSWYKDEGLLEISGTANSTTTTITNHNLTDEELKKMPDLNNFILQSKKEFSIGDNIINVHPINSSKNKISGHTTNMADILIKYNDNVEVVNADNNGYFECTLENTISDGTEIELISNVASSFIYGTRIVTSPYNGELSLMDTTKIFNFSLVPISSNPIIFGKSESISLVVVDSRINSSEWKIYAYMEKPLTSQNGYTLPGVLVFKKLDDETISLNETPSLVFKGTNNNGDAKRTLITWSKEKGPLLDLTNNSLEANEEYFAEVIFLLEE